mmetsp:Transcript_72382/g.151050  ORF Transcript_72382/g.151050 Transcript_72382/m.151050 type:complete len:899 (+) Transcript_72382:109-2805(+)
MMFGGGPMPPQGRDRYDQPLPMMSQMPQGMGLGGMNMPGMPGMGPMGGMGMPPMGGMGGMGLMGGMGGMPNVGRGGGKGMPPPQPYPSQAQGGPGGFGGGPSMPPPGSKGGKSGGGGGGGMKGGGGKGGPNHNGGAPKGGGGKGGMGGGMGPPQPQSNIPTQMSVNGVATWGYGQTSAGTPVKGGGKDAPPTGKGAPMPTGKGGKGMDNSQAHSNVFVGNLKEGTTKESLEQALSTHGPVRSCSVTTKGSRTFGFVKFATVQAAQSAIAANTHNPQGWLVKLANNDAAASPMKGFGKGDGKGDGKGLYGGKGPAQPQVKVDHSNVFVGGLAEGTTQDDLTAAFAPCGKIKSCLVSKKGEDTYGLVEFSTVAEAETAISQLNGKNGWEVKMANNDARSGGWDAPIPHSNVFVGSLADDIDKAMLEKVFSQHGTVLSCILHDKKAEDTPKPEEGEEESMAGKKYGFVKFATVAAAARAIDALDSQNGWVVKSANNDNGSAKGFGKGKWAWVPDDKWAAWGGKGWVWQPNTKNPENERPEPAASDNLYVKDLPPGISEEEVHATFSKIGSVVECRVLRWDNGSGCAALVRMASQELATRARAQLSGTVHESCVHPIQVSYKLKNGEMQKDHLYVSGIHCSATEEQVRKLFEKYGSVKWCSVQQPWTAQRSAKIPDATALVEMSSEEEAQKALEALNGHSPPELGQAMTVRYAESKQQPESDVKPNNNIYVKGWPVGFPDFLLQSIFQQYGSVLRLRLLENPDPEQPTCAALVQMSRVEEAAVAVRSLHGRTVPLAVPTMHLRYAGRDQGNSDNLYVTALPRTITESSLRQTFAKYGEIKRLKLLQQPGSFETHALVQLASPQVAAQALRELDGATPSFKGPTLFVTYAAKRESGPPGAGNR